MSSELPPQTRGSLLARLVDSADQAAWVEFVDVYSGLVHRDVCRRGVPHPDCDDVLQVIFLRLLKTLPEFQYQPFRGRFRDWLGTVIRFEVARYRRDHGRKREIALDPSVLDFQMTPDSDPEWSEAFQTTVLAAALERSRPRFDPATWEAFLQVWVAHRTPAEVANDFGKSVDWVYVAKSRALKMVAEQVQLLVDGFPFSQGTSDGD